MPIYLRFCSHIKKELLGGISAQGAMGAMEGRQGYPPHLSRVGSEAYQIPHDTPMTHSERFPCGDESEQQPSNRTEEHTQRKQSQSKSANGKYFATFLRPNIATKKAGQKL